MRSVDFRFEINKEGTVYKRLNLQACFILAVALVLSACSGQRVLMPTPNVYVDSSIDHYQEIHPNLKSTEVRLFYITDRIPGQDENGNLEYGYGRSPSLAFGSTVIDLGENISWEDLLEASRTDKRLKDIPLKRSALTEIARGPNAPIPYNEIDGVIVEDPDFVAKRAVAVEKFRQVMVQQLDLTPRKEVFIFVHGFHNDFNDAAFAMAELWHFLGRFGVPIVYTWPAGHPGLFGYTYDRESSEFTVYHFRQVVELISTFPEVEKINIIAHSRGTDVATTALRELTIEARAAGLNPREKYKIHNFVLAAPDLDAQVATQRMIGDHLAWSAHRFTLYTSPADRAIGWSRKLFDSPRGRVGNLRVEDMTETAKSTMERSNANFYVINFMSSTDKSDSNADSFGHSYFRNAPTVSSDLVLMLRDDVDPGPPGRPLKHLGYYFWEVPPGYPAR
jgi:esterase/lipase superfamily enzyme